MSPWIGAAIAGVAGFYLGFLLAAILAAILRAGAEADRQMNDLSAELERMRKAQE